MGVQSLSYHHRGIWFEILLLMHESEQRGLLLLNGRAITDEELSRLLGLDNQNTTSAITELLTSGVASREPKTGALMSRRMVRDERIRQIRIKVGKLGGNPLLLQGKHHKNLDNQKSTTTHNQKPGSSSSPSGNTSPSLRSGGAGAASPRAKRRRSGEHEANKGDIRSRAPVDAANGKRVAESAARQRNDAALGSKPPAIMSVIDADRYKWLKLEVMQFMAEVNGVKVSDVGWSDRDELASKTMLQASPGLDRPKVELCLKHRACSVQLGYLSASLQPSKWLRDLPSFLAGPLTKFHELIPRVGNGWKPSR